MSMLREGDEIILGCSLRERELWNLSALITSSWVNLFHNFNSDLGYSSMKIAESIDVIEHI